MKKIQEILRLRFECGLSYVNIASSVNSKPSTVGDYIRRFNGSGIGWATAKELPESHLEQIIFSSIPRFRSRKPVPNWSYIHQELRKKSVTKQLLWGEYKANFPDGYQYTQFCKMYKHWRSTCDLVFRNTFKAGEKVFVDYAGQTIPIYGPEIRYAQIFVGVLGASNYTFAEATLSQTLPDWVGSHIRMFNFFGGVPEVIVPDNLKSGVSIPCRYDPVINRTYYAMAKHYGTSVIPARPRKPRDKAKAEQGVLLAERWILASLRNRRFFSLDELNRAIRTLLKKLNAKPFQKLPGSRDSMFSDIEKTALMPLPQASFAMCDFKTSKVNINYHVEINRHNYSVPHQFVGKKVDVRFTSKIVEIFYDSQRIASHRRSDKVGGYTTLKDHMPEKHKAHVKWTPERMIHWVGRAGPSTTRVAKIVLESRDHPQQNFTRILGMIRLGDKFGQDRLEKACFCALQQNTTDYRSIKNILLSGRDQMLPAESAPEEPIDHQNIRGPDYYK